MSRPDPVSQPDDQPQQAQPPPHFRAVDPATFEYADVERDGKLYSVKLRPACRVQTPAVALTAALVDDDGDPLPFASLAVSGHFAAFVRKVEAAVLDACLANKAAWFRKDLDDDVLRAGFKSFLRPNGTLKLKVPEDVAVFDADKTLVAPGDVPAGTQVRAIIELAKVSFGKTEFGAMWRLVQVRALATPQCLIEDDAGDVPASDDDDFM
jgi:hypothetical protein